jgi:hypothetical protein
MVIGLKLLLPYSATSFAIKEVSIEPDHHAMIKLLMIQETKEKKDGT